MSHYIPLEYDRSHLMQSKKAMQTGVSLDYYDIMVITINALALLAIFIYYISAPKRVNEEITVTLSEKGSNDIPYFIFNRPGKKAKNKEAKDLKQKQFNPHTQITGYNLVELKCLKCTTYSTEIYQPKPAPETNS